MKRFQVKEKMWSLGGRFTISDQSGMPAYQVDGSFLKIPKTFTITDMSGRLVSRIRKQFMTFLPKFDVCLADGSCFTLRKELTFFKSRYRIDNLGLVVRGGFWDMDFELFQGDQRIASISQEWLRLTSTYNISVFEETYADLVISLVIAIDYVKEMEAGTSSST